MNMTLGTVAILCVVAAASMVWTLFMYLTGYYTSMRDILGRNGDGGYKRAAARYMVSQSNSEAELTEFIKKLKKKKTEEDSEFH